jgi:hypothetical protein
MRGLTVLPMITYNCESPSIPFDYPFDSSPLYFSKPKDKKKQVHRRNESKTEKGKLLESEHESMKARRVCEQA